VTDHEDRLNETFETHESQTPDPAAVYARVEELSRTYKWRRRGIQVAGGVVVGAGLIAGVVNLPAVLPSDPAAPQQGAAVVQAAAPQAVAASPANDETAMNAYWAAGYDYEDAAKLAKLWHSTGDIASVKAEAGRKLLAGETLPFPATPNPPASEVPVDPNIQKQLTAYFDAGYAWDDAVKLAKLWKLSDPSDAKIAAGKKLLAHEKLPFKPSPANVAAAVEQKQVEKFFDAGYDYADAQKLAKLWHTSPGKAKAEAGKRLLAGQSLPIQP
jgi:hypothetical protein